MTRIVLDENIPFGREVFSFLGEVAALPGRSITPEIVRDADLLIVRSVTHVDRRLLSGSRVRFVGTATIGTDHIDLEYLKEVGIAFADASGCNAESVAEYVTAALLDMEAALGISLVNKTLGIVGVGNVGKKVAAKAVALGMRTLLNDPPRAEKEGREGFVCLEEVLTCSDVVTLHTPLTREGKHPTWHLIGDRELHLIRPGAVLVNTSRGAVVDGDALLRSIRSDRLGAVVLDVWENEPCPDPELVTAVNLATPHIAGYSLDGKLTGTRMMLDAVARFLRIKVPEKARVPEIPVEGNRLNLIATGREGMREAVFRVYPIQEDDKRLRVFPTLPESERGAYFDRLRKEYPTRREFACYEVSGQFLDKDDRENLSALGFQITSRFPTR